ncbi:hypothetical protein K7W42_03950 [Deinococcus sp. HMF7604]|uniref:hypothetical protein n=1 Tax=Deinococcus betulae TaxID=2873312 RepID=UPI001CCE7B1F|nr:hypothetical protein [Deinococcus betulae]MBZ9750012.1 hypothetical protein [Deinococcus betulae]
MQEFQTLVREWETFYLLTGTAGATLAGLMFVAVTVGERATDRQRLPILRMHSDPALLAFVLNLVLSAALLIPSLTREWLGTLLLSAGGLGLVYLTVVLRHLHRRVQMRGWDLADWLWYAAAPIGACVLLLWSGTLTLSRHSHAALNLTGLTALVLLVMGIRNAWDLVTFALARVTGDGKDSQDTGTEATSTSPAENGSSD